MMIGISKFSLPKPLSEIADLTITPGGALIAKKSEMIFTLVVGGAILGLWIYFA
jgi:hypothetical protein